MSPRTFRPSADYPPCAECPLILVMLGRAHKGAMEGTGQFEVSISIEDALWQIYKYGNMTVCINSKKKARSEPFTGATTTEQITAHAMCNCRTWTEPQWNEASWYRSMHLCWTEVLLLGIVALCVGPQLAQPRSDRLVLPRACWFVDGDTFCIVYTLWEGL